MLTKYDIEKVCRVQEQAEHLKISLLNMTSLQDQDSDSRAQSHMFTSQADSLLHRYQALLAQVCGPYPPGSSHTCREAPTALFVLDV